MKKYLKRALAVLLLLAANQLNAQDTTVHVVQDFESWTSARFEYKFNKRFKIQLSENLRLEHNSSQLNQHFTELSLDYKVFDFLSLNGEMRYGYKEKNSGNTERFLRFFWAAKFQYDINRFTIKARLATQARNTLEPGGFGFMIVEGDYRYRLGLSYNFKDWKLDPTLSYEVFRPLSTFNPQFSKYRVKLSTDYSLKKKGELGFFMAYEHELNADYPLNATIVGVNYTFSAKRKKKDKKDEE